MMTPATTIPIQDWMSDPATQAVLAPLVNSDASEPAILFVGGCVRDALLGRPVVDVDMATVYAPEEVMRRLDAAGVGYHTPGLEHGTVAAHMDGRAFEITTLRVDVETDGRHARVAYTGDWALDASRRDFTMNALYADANGNVFDPLGGLADIEARRIRFIGDPNERIHEDALRILRFFRFNAQLEGSQLSPEGLAACRIHVGMLDHLSGERIREEVFKLLVTSSAVWILSESAFTEVLQHVLPQLTDVAGSIGLSSVVTLEENFAEPDSLRRLTALIENYPWRKADDVSSLIHDAEEISSRLRLSRDEARRLRSMIERPHDLVPRAEHVSKKSARDVKEWTHLEALFPIPRIQTLRRKWAKEERAKTQHVENMRGPVDINRRHFYVLNDQSWRDAVLLNWADHHTDVAEASQDVGGLRFDPDADWLGLLKLPDRKSRSLFPLRGADVISFDVEPGPEISRLLKEVESWWIDGDFEADRDECLAELARRVRLLSNSGGRV